MDSFHLGSTFIFSFFFLPIIFCSSTAPPARVSVRLSGWIGQAWRQAWRQAGLNLRPCRMGDGAAPRAVPCLLGLDDVHPLPYP
ncbi:hypothetical protein V8C44DRAFT_342370 [Trichoderma aethiopicum]